MKRLATLVLAGGLFLPVFAQQIFKAKWQGIGMQEFSASQPINAFTVHSDSGGQWQLIYSTDFSSNPNWTTNNSSRYYWSSNDYTYYYMENYENSTEYTYTATSWNSNSIKLEFDLEITQEAWGTHLGLGLYDANMSVNGNFLEAHFGHDDGGKLTSIFYHNQNGLLYQNHYGDFLLNTWYHFVLIYDKSTNSASLTVTEKATGNEFCTFTATGLSTFSGLCRLGFTNVGTTSYQSTIIGKIDNINYYNWVEGGDYVYLTAHAGASSGDIIRAKWQGTAVQGFSPGSNMISFETSGPDFEGYVTLTAVASNGQRGDILKTKWQGTAVQGYSAPAGYAIGGFDVNGSGSWVYLNAINIKTGPAIDEKGDQNRKTPFVFALNSITPNPCFGRSQISYSIAKFSKVNLQVYDCSGRIVKKLVNDGRKPGEYSLSWLGTDESGRKVSTGVYFVKLEAADFKAVKKIIIVK